MGALCDLLACLLVDDLGYDTMGQLQTFPATLSLALPRHQHGMVCHGILLQSDLFGSSWALSSSTSILS